VSKSQNLQSGPLQLKTSHTVGVFCTAATAVVKLHGSFLGSHVDISPSEPRSVLKLPGRLRSALR
jgi:hypothetical protein